MTESPKKLPPISRWGLVALLWLFLSAALAFGLRNLGWEATWASGIFLACLFAFGLLLAFSLIAAAIHLSVDTIQGRYPYQDASAATVAGPSRGAHQSVAKEAAPAPPEAERKSRLRTAVELLGVLTVTLGMTLILLEVALRLFLPQVSPEMQEEATKGLFIADKATAYRNLPGISRDFSLAESHTTITINSQGLREDHEIGSPQPGTTRLLCVGDSFTFGYGVEGNQAFPYLLNGSRTADGSTLESINSGVMGYGTDNEAAWLKNYGWQLQPKIIVVSFYVGNDVQDVMQGIGKTSVNDQRNLIPTKSGFLSPIKRWLAANSQAYVFLRSVSHNIFAPVSPQATKSILPNDTAPLYFRTEPADLAAGWEKAFGFLDAMSNDAHAHNAQFLVVAIPTREQVDDTYWQQMLKEFGLNDNNLQRDMPQQQLAQWSARTGNRLIDLLPSFRAAHDGPYYFKLDTHWNLKGHALAAQLIRDGLAHIPTQSTK